MKFKYVFTHPSDSRLFIIITEFNPGTKYHRVEAQGTKYLKKIIKDIKEKHQVDHSRNLFTKTLAQPMDNCAMLIEYQVKYGGATK